MAGTWRMSLLVSLRGSSFPILGILGPVFPHVFSEAAGFKQCVNYILRSPKNCKFEFKLLIFPFEQFQESRCSNNRFDGFCQCLLNCCMLEISRNLP